MPTSDLRYRASCHCQSVVLDFTAKENIENELGREVVICNCTICDKNGYINDYVPEENVTFVRGEDNLKAYSYPPHNRKHIFCLKCGTSMLIYSNDKIAWHGFIGINLRSVEGLDLQGLKFRIVNGRNRDPEDEMRDWAGEKAKRREESAGMASGSESGNATMS